MHRLAAAPPPPGSPSVPCSYRRWKAYQLTLKIIKERAKKHRYLDPMPDSRTNEVKNRTKKYKGFSQ